MLRAKVGYNSPKLDFYGQRWGVTRTSSACCRSQILLNALCVHVRMSHSMRSCTYFHVKLPTRSSMNASHILLHVIPAFWPVITAVHHGMVVTHALRLKRLRRLRLSKLQSPLWWFQ